MTLPRIGVSGVTREWEGAARTGVNAAYVQSIVDAGAVPLILSPLIGAARAAAALDGVDGLVLTGGEDIDPSFYRDEPSPRLGTVDRERDLFELALFAEARERGVPVLGICRGLQLINVALGGSLWQDLPSERRPSGQHAGADRRSARTHRVRILAQSRTALALGGGELEVNSFHHQGVRNLGPALVASAWADDGLVEAVESAVGDPWLVAVQWHPEELSADAASPDRGLFTALVGEARAAAIGVRR
ncbi:MAG: gamma-glutamyl-gamma-aminobutyrate hydrolase family protein [Gemmatimonadota bacterium]